MDRAARFAYTGGQLLLSYMGQKSWHDFFMPNVCCCARVICSYNVCHLQHA